MNSPIRFPRLFVRALSVLMFAVSSATGFEVGTKLPRPYQTRGGLVQPRKFTLPTAQLTEQTRVVLFFYSASWCTPCKEIGAALREAYSIFRARAKSIQVITYPINHSPQARADYLRDEAYPWPALGPTVIGSPPWLAVLPGGTPQFQAFAVAADHLEALTPPGPVDEVFSTALEFLHDETSPPYP